MDLAAVTNSFSRRDRNSPRTILAQLGQLIKPTTPTTSPKLGAKSRRQQNRHEKHRQHLKGFCDLKEQRADIAISITCQTSHDYADYGRQSRGCQTDQQRNPGAVNYTRKHISSQLVRSQPIHCTGAALRRKMIVKWAIGRYYWGQHSDQNNNGQHRQTYHRSLIFPESAAKFPKTFPAERSALPVD